MRRWLAAVGLLVLCCCQTDGGGTCCAQMHYCGPIVLGCFCSPGRCGTVEAP